MTSGRGTEVDGAISPEEAFSILGDQARLQILRTLGEADEPLAFSELFDRIEYDTTANFSYHLNKLAGHFIRETDEGYALRRAGSRIIEAIYSGAITHDPVLERAPVDQPCPLCGGSMEISYRDESSIGYCTECQGTRGGSIAPREWPVDSADDVVGQIRLPPAGLQGRTPTELVQAAEVWSAIQGRAVARGVCHSCSAPVDESVVVCDAHDASGGAL